jgi:hypothetical protein
VLVTAYLRQSVRAGVDDVALIAAEANVRPVCGAVEAERSGGAMHI